MTVEALSARLRRWRELQRAEALADPDPEANAIMDALWRVAESAARRVETGGAAGLHEALRQLDAALPAEIPR